MNNEIATLILKAARSKFRFNSSKGLLTFEQLWDVPLTNKTSPFSLDNIAKEIYKDVKEGEEISFVVNRSVKSTEASDRLELVKYVISVRKDELQAREDQLKKQEEKKKIMEILERKKDASLENLSEEQLMSRLQLL